MKQSPYSPKSDFLEPPFGGQDENLQLELKRNYLITILKETVTREICDSRMFDAHNLCLAAIYRLVILISKHKHSVFVYSIEECKNCEDHQKLKFLMIQRFRTIAIIS
jgi:hypothetical protein